MNILGQVIFRSTGRVLSQKHFNGFEVFSLGDRTVIAYASGPFRISYMSGKLIGNSWHESCQASKI